MDKKKFEQIKEDYGHVSSWAIWDKCDIGNIDIFDIEKGDELLTRLKPHIVLVGLNLSGELEEGKKFSNFHGGAGGSIYPLRKLRHALTDTPLEGAYMTDIIKCFPDPNSKNVSKVLKEYPEVLEENFRKFHKEICDLGVDKIFLRELMHPINKII